MTTWADVVRDMFSEGNSVFWFLLLLDVLLKGLVLLALAGGLTWAMRRFSPAERHLVWAAALTCLLFLPVLSATLPAWRVLPSWLAPIENLTAVATSKTESLQPKISSPESSLDPPDLMEPTPSIEPLAISPPNEPIIPGEAEKSDEPIAALPTSAEPVPFNPEQSLATVIAPWLVTIWACGVAICLAPIVLGHLRLRKQRRTARELTEGPWPSLLHETCSQLRLHRRVTLLEHDDCSMPMVWGLLRSKLLLPTASSEWSPERRRVVLLHELAHVKRYDCAIKMVSHLARAIHWFNPLVWIAAKRIQIESEQACDNLVLGVGPRASDYAEHLLEITSQLQTGSLAVHNSMAMACPNELEGRVEAILSPTRNRRRLGPFALLFTAFLTLGVNVPLACMQPEQTTGNNTQRTEQKETGNGKGVRHLLSPEVKRLLERINDWHTQETDYYERPDQAPDNYVVSGESVGYLEDCKEQLAKLGVLVQWNGDKMRYEIAEPSPDGDGPAENVVDAKTYSHLFSYNLKFKPAINEQSPHFVATLTNQSTKDLNVTVNDKAFHATITLISPSGGDMKFYDRQYRLLLLTATWLEPTVGMKPGASLTWKVPVSSLVSLHEMKLTEEALKGCQAFSEMNVGVEPEEMQAGKSYSLWNAQQRSNVIALTGTGKGAKILSPEVDLPKAKNSLPLDAKKAKAAPVILRIRVLEEYGGSKYLWSKVQVLEVLKNETEHKLPEEFRLAHYSVGAGLPPGVSTVYITPYNLANPEAKGLWRLVEEVTLEEQKVPGYSHHVPENPQAEDANNQIPIELHLDKITSSEWVDAGVSYSLQLSCDIRLVNNSGKELTVKSHGMSVHDGLILIISDDQGKELTRQAYALRISPHFDLHSLSLPVGTRKETLSFVFDDPSLSGKDLMIHFVGGLPGTKYETGLKSNSYSLPALFGTNKDDKTAVPK